jgi:hypothetical protein
MCGTGIRIFEIEKKLEKKKKEPRTNLRLTASSRPKPLILNWNRRFSIKVKNRPILVPTT